MARGERNNLREERFMKKNWVVGFALVATLMSGCQTAQKSAALDESFLDIPSNYGSDRTPAGNPIAEQLAKIFKARGETGASEMKALISELNKEKGAFANDAELKAFRKKYGNVTEENFSSLDSALSASIIENLAKLPRFRTLISYDASFKNLAAQAKTILAKGSKSGVEESKAVNAFSKTGLLNAGNKAEQMGKTYDPKVLERYYQRTIYEQAIKENALYATTEGKEALLGALKKAKEYHELTGRSIITVETCRNLDVAATRKYTELLDEHVASARKYGKACPELEAWVAARFQMSLGREGIGAWTAAEELAICGTETPETGRAARSLASKYQGRVPNDPPKCK
jgi:hypothetical protein